MLNHVLSDVACIDWFMDWKWQLWYGFGMENERRLVI